jgi:hypothetical protein
LRRPVLPGPESVSWDAASYGPGADFSHKIHLAVLGLAVPLAWLDREPWWYAGSSPRARQVCDCQNAHEEAPFGGVLEQMEKKFAVLSNRSILVALCLALALAGSIWAFALADVPERRIGRGTDKVDSPTVTSFTKETSENTPIGFSLSDFSDNFSTPEESTLTTVRIEKLTLDGMLRLSGVEVALDQEIDAGNLDELSYNPDTNWSGDTYFEWNGSDGGESYADESAQVIITVIADNVRPTVTSFLKTTPKATPLKFATADFTSNFNDDDGDELEEIKIISLPLPTDGSLRFDGDNVDLNQEIDSEDIGDLSFNPAPGFTGSTSFGWNGSDGDAYAVNPALVNITVTQTNDPPTVTSFSVETAEDKALSFTLNDFTNNFDDLNGDPLNEIRIQSLPDNGSLSLSGLAVKENQEIVAASISNLTFNPEANWFGSTSFGWNGSDEDDYAATPAKVNISVTPVNDAPEIDLNGNASGTGFSSDFVFGGPAVDITSSNLTVIDVDNNNLASAIVTITNRKHGTRERLLATTTGMNITAAFNADNGVLNLTGPDSVANFQTVLSTVRFRIEPDVTDLDTAERNINFSVNDRQLDSNVAEAKVKILDPRLQLTVKPLNQTVFKGGTAIFNVEVKNTGNVNLTNVTVSASTVESCNKSIGLLKVDETNAYVCSVAGVTGPLDNVITATANNIGGVSVSSSVTARVRLPADIVVNVAPDPLVGNLIPRGQNAVFDITIRNPLPNSKIKNVSVEAVLDYGTAELSPDAENELISAPPECNREISELAAGQQLVYSCVIPNVQSSFTILVEATGLIEGIGLTSNSDTSSATVIGLNLNVVATPGQIPADTATSVKYELTLTNTGDLALNLTSLQSAIHGDLLNTNTPVTANTCPSIVKNIPTGGVRTCSYSVTLNLPANAFTVANLVTAEATTSGAELMVENTAIVRVGDDLPISVNLSASPNELTAPGGVTNLSVVVANATNKPVNLRELSDSVLGDLDGVGTCKLPHLIAAGGQYSCTYPVTISNQQPGDQVSHKVIATTSLGQFDDTVTINIVDLSPTSVLMPVIGSGVIGGEPHNFPCRALPLMTDLSYYFLPDDPNDWYRFYLPSPRRVVIRLNNYVAEGQIVVFSGNCSTPDYIKNNGNNRPIKEVDLGVLPAIDSQGQRITYFIWVVTDSGFSQTNYYTLRIDTSAP